MSMSPLLDASTLNGLANGWAALALDILWKGSLLLAPGLHAIRPISGPRQLSADSAVQDRRPVPRCVDQPFRISLILADKSSRL